MHVAHKEHLAVVHDISLFVLLFYPSKSGKHTVLLIQSTKRDLFQKKGKKIFLLLIIH
jgi:hypothetical protein